VRIPSFKKQNGSRKKIKTNFILAFVPDFVAKMGPTLSDPSILKKFDLTKNVSNFKNPVLKSGGKKGLDLI
jgi:hypothetical protein